MPRESRQEKEQQALALIRQRPGINEESLAIALGYERENNGRQRNRTVKTIWRSLVKKKLVKAEKKKFAKAREPFCLYPADYQKPVSKGRSAVELYPPCKVYQVPLEELDKYRGGVA